MSNRNSQHGVTLAELVIVVAIIGILGALARPAFLRSVAAGRSARAARGVAEVVRYARAESLSRNRAIRLQLFPVAANAKGGYVTMVPGTTTVCSGIPNGVPGASGTFTYDIATEVNNVGMDSVVGGTDLCIKPGGDLYNYATLAAVDEVIAKVAVMRNGGRFNERTIRIGANGSVRVQ